MEYSDISYSSLNQKYDMAVYNFSLIGKEPVEQLFQRVLTGKGHFVIQTLHHHVACGAPPYLDGWRED